MGHRTHQPTTRFSNWLTRNSHNLTAALYQRHLLQLFTTLECVCHSKAMDSQLFDQFLEDRWSADPCDSKPVNTGSDLCPNYMWFNQYDPLAFDFEDLQSLGDLESCNLSNSSSPPEFALPSPISDASSLTAEDRFDQKSFIDPWLHLPAARSPIHHGTLTKMRKQRSRSRKSQCGREKGGINRPKLRRANRLRLSASAKTTRTT